MHIAVCPVRTAAQVEMLAALFREYAAGLGVAAVIEAAEEEIAAMPGRYAASAGELFLVLEGAEQASGCIGVRPLDDPGTCEIKRLYMRPASRGSGAGRVLIEAALAFAAAAGYRRVVLDTMPAMQAAIELYRRLGFTPAAPYDPDGMPGLLCFERLLH